MAFNPLANPEKTTTNLQQLSVATNAAAALSGLIAATPIINNIRGYQPLPLATANTSLFSSLLGLGPPDSLTFHTEGENTFRVSSDITDHYIEDNTAIQDQIALKPEVITVSGFIGELTDIVPNFLQPFQTIANTLTSVSAYTPQLSTTALIAYNEAVFAYENLHSIANNAVNAWSNIVAFNADKPIGDSLFTVGTGTQTNQAKMFQTFYGYWFNRTLFNVQTPWAVMSNMAILDLQAVQDEETRMISNFKVTFKKIRTAQTAFGSPLTQGRLGAATSDLSNNGTSTGASTSSTLGSEISSIA